MKVLTVEGAPGVGAAAEAELRGAGFMVVGCDASDASSPCRGLENVADCPLDSGDVDVAVVSRAGSEFAASERGALCAARHRVPVVVAGNPRHAVSFGPGTHLAGPDLVNTVDIAARSGTAHVAAIRRADRGSDAAIGRTRGPVAAWSRIVVDVEIDLIRDRRRGRRRDRR